MRCFSRLTMFAAITLILAAFGSTKLLAADAYEMALVPPPAGGSPSIFRLNVSTGDVSYVSGTSYLGVPEPQPIPSGTYRLYLTPASDNKVFWLYRLESQTGRTWFYSNNTWIEVVQAK